MGHKCFISFKSTDIEYKVKIQNELEVDMIDKSLNEPINSEDQDYIMKVIRKDYLNDSTVTICLIGSNSAEYLNNLTTNQYYIKKELQASLSNTSISTKNGILGVVLPSMYDEVFKGEELCVTCGKSHNIVKINDFTTIKEFSYNYYVPNNKCAWSYEDHYCVLVKWDDFSKQPNFYIDLAYDKRSAPIANKTKVRPV